MSRYLIKHRGKSTFRSALERVQCQIWDTKRHEHLTGCETPCDYDLSVVDNLSEGWRVSLAGGAQPRHNVPQSILWLHLTCDKVAWGYNSIEGMLHVQ
jgi:hypothetical protein